MAGGSAAAAAAAAQASSEAAVNAANAANAASAAYSNVNWSLPVFKDSGDGEAFEAFDDWRFQVVTTLADRNLEGVLLGTDDDAKNVTKVFCKLAQACQGNALKVLRQFEHSRDGKAAFEALVAKYEGNGELNVVRLL